MSHATRDIIGSSLLKELPTEVAKLLEETLRLLFLTFFFDITTTRLSLSMVQDSAASLLCLLPTFYL